MSGWAAALDCYESALDAHDAALREGRDPGEVGWPPQDLPDGGVPDEHRGRALALLARTQQLAAELRRRRDAMPAPAGGHRAPRRPLPGPPGLVDRAI